MFHQETSPSTFNDVEPYLFILVTGASGFTIGAVSIQNMGQVEHPVADARP